LRRGTRVWLAGNGHVREVSPPPATGEYGRCVMTLIIDVPDVERSTQVVRHIRVAVAKWPDVGDDLPIEVASDDRQQVRVLWDKVPTHAEIAAREQLLDEYEEESAEERVDALVALVAAGPDGLGAEEGRIDGEAITVGLATRPAPDPAHVGATAQAPAL